MLETRWGWDTWANTDRSLSNMGAYLASVVPDLGVWATKGERRDRCYCTIFRLLWREPPILRCWHTSQAGGHLGRAENDLRAWRQADGLGGERKCTRHRSKCNRRRGHRCKCNQKEMWEVSSQQRSTGQKVFWIHLVNPANFILPPTPHPY